MNISSFNNSHYIGNFYLKYILDILTNDLFIIFKNKHRKCLLRKMFYKFDKDGNITLVNKVPMQTISIFTNSHYISPTI